MKKIGIVIMIVLLAATGTYAQKASKSFKGIANLYNTQVEIFLAEVFELQKTGLVMSATAKAELDQKIYEAFLIDFAKWAAFTQKYEGGKKFDLKLKGTKDFEAESKEYLAQFKLIQAEFVKERLIWTEAELSKVLTIEKLQKYIDPVTKKFEDRTKALFTKLVNNK